MREIVLDTETTGLDPSRGDRIVEIGCLELVDRVWTGRTWHSYVNPERPMSEDAYRVHGISDADLADKPVFAAIVDGFLAFIGEAPLVIHNAEFDMRFLNHELSLAGRPLLPRDRAVDTLAIARKRFPGAPASLDALCKRFGVDNSTRDLHGALIDSELLAGVYYHLLSARQTGLAFDGRTEGEVGDVKRPYRAPRPHAPTAAELAAHQNFVESALNDALWRK